ncbi:MAG TPA: transaldolase family protein [Myxococcota bacterium]|nr:transaldolase family protein [Myxococcota bacterium]HQK51675.1 transaldolase family protein [Myxococcota bacterium]
MPRGPEDSPLSRSVRQTPTVFWNDSCAEDELRDAIAHGAVGGTTNPTIVLEVLRKEYRKWQPRILALAKEMPTASEVEITWRLVEEMALAGAALLRPVFDDLGGRGGRISIQTNPQFYRDARALVDQAVHFAGLAPNLQVKIPATRAGIMAIEEATFRGVNINATVSFTVPQALAVAEAVERGLDRRRAAGLDTESMTPVCTIMVGRLDDWLKVVAKRDGIVCTPGDLDWAGIAVIKRAYGIYRERGYRTRLLAAAYRHHLHWSELIGGDLILTIPHAWQRLFHDSDIEVRPRFDDPVDPGILQGLLRRFPDFRMACEPDGLSVEQFDRYGATVRTLRTFLGSYGDLLATVRDVLLPDPDVRQADGVAR